MRTRSFAWEWSRSSNERRRRESAGLRKMTGASGLIYMVRAVKDDD